MRLDLAAGPAPPRTVAPQGPRGDREGPGHASAANACARRGLEVAEDASVVFDPNRPALPRARCTLPVLYEDEHVIVIDKPAGLLSVPSAPGAARRGHGPVAGAGLRAPPEAAGRLRRASAPPRPRHLGRARLRAVARGARRTDPDLPRPPHRARVRRGRRRRGARGPRDRGRADARGVDERPQAASPRGDEPQRPALTRWRVRERLPGAALLDVALETGRQHQIRVHLAHVGLPILGDPVYGRPPAAGLARRPMLHAAPARLRAPDHGPAGRRREPAARGLPEGARRPAPRRPPADPTRRTMMRPDPAAPGRALPRGLGRGRDREAADDGGRPLGDPEGRDAGARPRRDDDRLHGDHLRPGREPRQRRHLDPARGGRHAAAAHHQQGRRTARPTGAPTGGGSPSSRSATATRRRSSTSCRSTAARRSASPTCRPGVSIPKWLPDGKRIAFVAHVVAGAESPEATKKALEAREKAKVKARVTENRLYRFWDRWLTDDECPHLFVVDLETTAVVRPPARLEALLRPPGRRRGLRRRPDGRDDRLRRQLHRAALPHCSTPTSSRSGPRAATCET